MSVKFSFQIRVSEDIKTLAQRFPRYAQPVLNRCAQQAQSLAAKTVAQDYNVTAPYIKKRISVIKSTGQSLVAILRFSQKAFNPYFFLKSKEPTTRRQPVILEIKKGSSIFAGNKFFTNIGKKSGMLKILWQPSENRTHLILMEYLKANQIFNYEKIESVLEKFINTYMAKELPRVITVMYKAGK